MAKLERPYFYTAIDLDYLPLGPYDDMRHITVTPPVTELPEAPIDMIVDALQKRARSIGTLTLAVADLALFGPEQTIPVRTIADPSGLLALTHRRMLAVLTEHGYTIDSTYTGGNYHPHTTLVANQPTPEGIIHVESLVVARSTAPCTKEIYAQIPLHA